MMRPKCHESSGLFVASDDHVRREFVRRAQDYHDDETLSLTDPSVTRRDFVGGALLGTGAALLGMAAPGLLRATGRAACAPTEAPPSPSSASTGPARGASATTAARTATRTKS